MNESTLPTPSVNVAPVALSQLPAGSAVNNVLKWDGTKWEPAVWPAAFKMISATSGVPSINNDLITITTATAITLNDSTVTGQEITLLKMDNNSQLVISARGTGFTVLTFTAVGQSATLQGVDGYWYIKSIRGATIS